MVEIKNKLISIIKGKINYNQDNIIFCLNKGDSFDLINDLGLTSLNLIELVIKIENEFNIEFDDEQLDFNNITIFSNLLDYIAYKLEMRNG